MRVYVLVLVLCCGLIACSEERHLPTVPGVKPGTVTSYSVADFSGASEITYDIPDENTAYVLAEYEPVSGVKKEMKASKYKNTLRLEGFAAAGRYNVTLYAVSTDEQRSDPVVVEINPLEPPYKLAFSSLDVGPAFGGFKTAYTNVAQTALMLEVITRNADGEWAVIERSSSALEQARFTARGYASEENTYGFYIRDRWSNFSDTLFADITPYFEQLIDMSGFYETNFPTDQFQGHLTGVAGGRRISFLFDGLFTQTRSWYTQATSGVPQHFTIYLQDTYQLSRIKLWQRGGNDYYYQAANPRHFEVYGSVDPNPDGSWESWTLLATFENMKPSGDPVGANSAEDNATAAAGENYEFDVDIPPVRYIRFRTTETWGLQSFVYIAEMEIYGAKAASPN